MSEFPTVYLFVHVIWTVKGRAALLTRPLRRVLFVHLQKDGEEKGLHVLAVNGVEDHIHLLLQLMPSQNLSQVVRSIRAGAASWINESKFLTTEVEWEENYIAYSVSPSGLKQQKEYIEKQEEYHKTKTIDNELEAFEKLKESIV